MKAVLKFVFVVGAAVAISACAAPELRSQLVPSGMIDAGITGNPEIASAGVQDTGTRLATPT